MTECPWCNSKKMACTVEREYVRNTLKLTLAIHWCNCGCLFHDGTAVWEPWYEIKTGESRPIRIDRKEMPIDVGIYAKVESKYTDIERMKLTIEDILNRRESELQEPYLEVPCDCIGGENYDR